jgi:tetratricopeptide (TPR) repeat protein/predicted Ser/Thr protein kinase
MADDPPRPRSVGLDATVAPSDPAAKVDTLAATVASGTAAKVDTLAATVASGAALGTMPDSLAATVASGVDSLSPTKRDRVHGAVVGDIDPQVGRYLIRRRLGEGGMGVVYAAQDPDLDREVALKVIRAQSGEAAEVRLFREAQAIAKLVHPNVVSVYDVGRHEGRPFIAMELVDGQPLSDWLLQPRPWREVVRVLGRAARGLIAAHDVGLIHRDFKPANVFLGSDGRVKVGDFGLARPEQDAEPRPVARDAALSDLTATGALVGTPAYMAPEQLAGEPATARTDQFSLAVAIYEALYGERPFVGNTLYALIESVSSGQVKQPTAQRDVPAWLRQAVLRGLSKDPQARYPSVAAFLSAIERDPVARRRRIAVGAVALVAAGGIGVGASVMMSRDRCSGVDSELAAVWNPERRGAVERGFRAHASPYTEAALARAVAALDADVDRWRAMKLGSCRATERGEQTQAHSGLRDVCLSARRIELESAIDLFAHADGDVIRRANEVIRGLGDIARCGDLAALTQAVPPPSTPAARAEVAAIERAIADARALGEVGRYQPAFDAAVATAAKAEPLQYPPVHARALGLAGELADRLGKPQDAERLLTESMLAAEAGRDDVTKARALTGLVRTIGVAQGRHAEALEAARRAEATIKRLGNQQEATTDLLRFRGMILEDKGDLAEARKAFQTAYDNDKRFSPTNAGDIASDANSLGLLLVDLNEIAAGKKLLEEALALRLELYGPDHPEYAAAVFNLGNAYLRAGDPVAAEASYRKSLAIRERVLPPDHPEVGLSLANIGVVLREGKRYDEALEMFRRALAILDKTGGGAPTSGLVIARYNVGATLFLSGALGPARTELERALEVAVAAKISEGAEAGAIVATLGQIARVERRWDDAMQLAERAMAIDTKLYGPEHTSVGEDYDSLGDLLQAQGKWSEAEAAYARSLAIKEKALGPDNVALAISLTNLGTAARSLKRYKEALAYCERALKLDEAALGSEHPDLMYDLAGIAKAKAALGDRKEAVPLFERALALPHADASGVAYHEVELAFGETLLAIGDRKRAKEMAGRALAGLRDDPTLLAEAKQLAARVK